MKTSFDLTSLRSCPSSDTCKLHGVLLHFFCYNFHYCYQICIFIKSFKFSWEVNTVLTVKQNYISMFTTLLRPRVSLGLKPRFYKQLCMHDLVGNFTHVLVRRASAFAGWKRGKAHYLEDLLETVMLCSEFTSGPNLEEEFGSRSFIF